MSARRSRSLRVQLAVVGFVAIYAPVLLVFGVDTVTYEEVTTTAEGTTRAMSGGGGSGWVVATVVLLAPIAAALAWWWAGRATRPLDRVRQAADDIGETDLSRRIGLGRGPTEVVALAASFDAMLDRLDVAAATQHRLIEETSHALRTPLAVLATNHDILLTQQGASVDDHLAGWARTRAATARMAATVDDLLVEARGRARIIDRRPADLVAVVGEVVEDARTVAAAHEVEVVLGGAEDVVVAIDATTVRRAVANLVDNAIRFAPAGTAVEVVVGEVWVAVTDHGPGLSPESQARVFDRFWRGDTRAGTGLGLPIAAQVARAHGGHVSVASPGPSGDGCTFKLDLDQSPPPEGRAGSGRGDRGAPRSSDP